MTIHTQIAEAFRAPPILAAEFTIGSKTRAAVLSINLIDAARGERRPVSTHEVFGKREARAIAKALGATPWNF